MKRLIRDEVVLQRAEELGLDTVYLRNVPVYAGTVDNTLVKVRLESTAYGMIKVPIEHSLRAKFDAIKLEPAKEYKVTVKGRSFTVTEVQLRLLKALVLEQVNRNADYSEIVTRIFFWFLKQIVNGEVTGDFTKEIDEDRPPMQNAIIKSFSEFMSKQLREEEQTCSSC